MSLERKPDESVFEYKLRICRELDGVKTWQEIADIVNDELGTEFGESAIRKWYVPIRQYMDYQRDHGSTDNELLQQIKDEQLRLEKLKVQVADERRAYKAIVRESARFDNIIDKLKSSFDELATLKPLEWSKPQTYISNTDGVVLWSDWHYGAFADNYFNQFNNDVFKRRLDKLISKTIQYGTFNGIETLHVMNLGDSISGHIHVSTRIQSTENVISQTQHVSEYISEALVELCRHFGNVKYYHVRGNHDRVNHLSKDTNISAESFSDLIPWYVSARTGHVRNLEIMENPYDDEIAVADVQGHICLGIHGHKDKLNNVAADLTLMLGVKPASIFLGHYHHSAERESTGGIDVIQNPSYIGTDEYSRNIRKTSKPAQKMLIYSRDEGRICTYNIGL
ncbi:hypothetical protein [Alicyclobacillus acidoterrestris]|uniref:Uncharacterized protein n=1 Tax=Alicyclobacillus acidoterrestris (strain ATCC 49025 / DSM 3922 / CIP 106132 / NCIMB 13137 / GD3B) TaxID=1356854 RepID=T0BUF8_ALIAG|nr:hypothetical protein [Alicyclobacillus acidoterrestris]EPZ47728.1 hypothetical protein N007_05595 [Alicyclobacillus acidoterrestris ATCC 49025]UNO47963.1 hypothetical protein K1I37_14915 [Alicyclobacillus acidoterrestris]